MSANTKIEWADHTFNPWQGCTKISPGCAHCYAATHDARHLHDSVSHWGKGVPRKLASEATWRQPVRWNRDAAAKCCGHCHYCEATGELIERCQECAAFRPKVFCASLADWLDDEVPIEWLARLLALIHDTPELDWLLLTKRPENWRGRVQAVIEWIEGAECAVAAWSSEAANDEICEVWSMLNDWVHGDAPENVWLGTSVEDQARADERVPRLLAIPARVRFLSCEPLLGAVDLKAFARFDSCPEEIIHRDGCVGCKADGRGDCQAKVKMPIDWIICGGESGSGARPMHPEWARGLRAQCAAAGVAFFFKQWGEWCPFSQIPDDTLATVDLETIKTLSSGADSFHRVGKKAAGRLLDGREYSEFPR